MAAAIARSLLGLTAEVQSAGLETADGLPATKHAVTVMKEMGLDASQHRSRSIQNFDVKVFDLIIAMTPDIASKLCAMGAESRKIRSLHVSGPYGRSVEVYRTTANEISEKLRRLFGQDMRGDIDDEL